ncbi:MAG: hypothetical protein ACPL4E_09355, partial [Thermoproteota archaeon]
RRQVEMGYVSFAMPARELFEEEMLDYFLPQILLTLKRSLKNDFEFLLYGVGVKLWKYTSAIATSLGS